MIMTLLALCLDTLFVSGCNCQGESYCIIANDFFCYLPESKYTDLSRNAVQ